MVTYTLSPNATVSFDQDPTGEEVCIWVKREWGSGSGDELGHPTVRIPMIQYVVEILGGSGLFNRAMSLFGKNANLQGSRGKYAGR